MPYLAASLEDRSSSVLREPITTIGMLDRPSIIFAPTLLQHAHGDDEMLALISKLARQALQRLTQGR